jgi:hypothetical protein
MTAKSSSAASVHTRGSINARSFVVEQPFAPPYGAPLRHAVCVAGCRPKPLALWRETSGHSWPPSNSEMRGSKTAFIANRSASKSISPYVTPPHESSIRQKCPGQNLTALLKGRLWLGTSTTRFSPPIMGVKSFALKPCCSMRNLIASRVREVTG